MQTTIRNYDLDVARALLLAKVDVERGLGNHDYATGLIRRRLDASDTVRSTQWSILDALATLPASEGGTLVQNQSTKRWGTSADELRAERPLVQALLVLRSHPSHPGFSSCRLARVDEWTEDWRGGPQDVTARLQRLYDATRPAWSIDTLQQLVFQCACDAFGDDPIESISAPDEIYPATRIGEPFRLLNEIMLFDIFGAFDPAFTRQDALRGEWWLIQPASPRLVNDEIADRAGLKLAGYLPQSAVDAPGRVVMACYEREPMDSARCAEILDDSKWVNGWQRVQWTRSASPLNDPAFDLVATLETITRDRESVWKHSSELPAFPPR